MFKINFDFPPHSMSYSKPLTFWNLLIFKTYCDRLVIILVIDTMTSFTFFALRIKMLCLYFVLH